MAGNAQLNKAYKYLEKNELYAAYDNFLKYKKELKPDSKDLPEAYFGLFCYYELEGNESMDLRTAWFYLDSAMATFKDKFKVKYAPYEEGDMTRVRLADLKLKTERRAYAKAMSVNSQREWMKFLEDYKMIFNSPLLDSATQNLYTTAYEYCASVRNANCLVNYIKLYPKSKYVPQARDLIDTVRYEDALELNTRKGYVDFVNEFPDNPFYSVVMDTLSNIDYRHALDLNMVYSYERYLEVYPYTKHKKELNEKICAMVYDSIATVNTEEAWNFYLKKRKNCPQAREAEKKIEAINAAKCFNNPTMECLENVLNNAHDNNLVRQAKIKLEDLKAANCFGAPTKECLAQLIKESKDSVVIKKAQFKLDELERPDSVATEEVSPPVNNSGLTPFQVGKKWGFVDKDQNVIIKAKYDEVGDFVKGKAVVRIGNKWGVIDEKGKELSPMK